MGDPSGSSDRIGLDGSIGAPRDLPVPPPFGFRSAHGLMGELLPFLVPAALGWAVPGWAPGWPWLAQLISAVSMAVYLFAKLSVAQRTAMPVNTDPNKVFREEGKTVLVPRRYPSAAEAGGKSVRKVTMADLRKHNTAQDLWIAVDGHAYDVTRYLKRHPGGSLVLLHLAGRDATDMVENYHPASVFQTWLPQFHVGEIVDHTVSELVAGHRSIRQELLRQGMFESDTAFYVMHGARCAAMLMTAMWLTVCGTNTVHRLAGAAILAMYWQQVAFLGHDIGHNNLTQRRASAFNWGTVLATATGGISVSWWKHNHNTHHITCNSIEHDPDVQHQPILATTTKAFTSFVSSFYDVEFSLDTDLLGLTLVSYQHYLFFPVMMFARFFLYVRSWIHVIFHTGYMDRQRQQIAQLFVFACSLTTICWVLPSWNERLAYLFTAHAFAGVLHLQIVLSHFPMEMYSGLPYNDDSDEWLVTQCRTTQNILCQSRLDWFHGGLQFQIEHHVWPRLPRHNLREARSMLKPYCLKQGVPYVEQPWFQAIAHLVQSLQDVALQARLRPSKAPGFFDSSVWSVLNARG